MEKDISVMRSYYETLNKNVSELFWKITPNQLFETALAEALFNEIIRDWHIFGNEIWTAISGLRNDGEGKYNAHREHVNRINDDLPRVKAGDDYWTKAVDPWLQGHERRHEHLAVYVG
jgi:hypothetical protein